MAKTYRQIADTIRYILQDMDLESYGTEEIDSYIKDGLVELAMFQPHHIVKVPFDEDLFTNKEVDISSVIDALFVARVDYPRNDDGITKRNFEVQDGVLTIDIDDDPTEDVYIHFAKRHKLSQLTDFAAAVNNASGYSAAATSMAINGLQSSGFIEEGQEFTIAGLDNVYTVTEQATISSNAATISFYPGLESAVANAVVITFKQSSLNPMQEALLAEWVAGSVAVSKSGVGLRQITAAITDLDSLTDNIESVTARITQAVTDIDSGRTEVAKMPAMILSAGTAIGNITNQMATALSDMSSARSQVALMETPIAEAGSAVDNITNTIATAQADLGSARANVELMPTAILKAGTIYDGLTAQLATVMSDLASARTQIELMPTAILKAGTVIALITDRATVAINDLSSARAQAELMPPIILDAGTAIAQGSTQLTNVLTELSNSATLLNEITVGRGAPEYIEQARAFLGLTNGYMQEGIALLRQSNNDGSLTNIYGNLAARELQTATQYVQQASAYLRESSADGDAANNYASLASRSLSAVSGYLQQALGYIRESGADAAVVQSYGNLARTELSVSDKYLQQAVGYMREANARQGNAAAYSNLANMQISMANGYIAQANVYLRQASEEGVAANSYGNMSARELSAAREYLNQATAYMRSIQAKMQIAAGSRAIENWGRNKINDVLGKLNRMAGQKVSETYAKD